MTFQQKNKKYVKDNVSYLMTLCADKIEVKNYVKYTLNEEIYPKTLKIYNNANEINLNELPDKFVLKCNNACAHNIFCFDKKTFNLESAKEKLNTWVNRVAGEISGEYQYCKINRKIFAEELLECDKELLDYRFWCFNGRPHFLAISSGMSGQNFYDLNFNPIDLINSAHPPRKNKEFIKPENFEKMIDYATKLSTNFKFVRVDMYNINGNIYLGEMTFSPSGYKFHFINSKEEILDEKIGELLNLD